MKLADRARLYSEAFPRFPPLRADDRWIDGMWVLGNDYKGSGFYGAYPPSLLRRLGSMFPDQKPVLHVFSGSLPPGDYVRFDLVKDADVKGDAEELSRHFKARKFRLVYADPPYTTHDARLYGTPLVNKRKVFAECAKVTQKGGFLLWLDQSLPMHRKTEWRLVGLVGIVRSTNHKFRVVSIFERMA